MRNISVWEKESFFAPQDVIIVGSGFVGLWCAFHLLQKNPALKITIVERGTIPTGASTRNAGFSCFGSPSELVNDIKAMGEDKTWQLVEMRYKGLSEIKKYFDAAQIDYNEDGGYECFADDSEDWRQCSEKIDWLNEGLKKISGEINLYSIADEKLSLFGLKGFDHLIENKEEGGLHSGKLIQALLQKVQGAGVQVLTATEVDSYENNNDCIHVHVKCSQPEPYEVTIKTKQLLLCTNAFTKKLFPAVDITPCRGQVVVTSPVADLKLKGSFHFERGYYYFRNLGNRILIGGARNKNFAAEDTDVMQVTSSIQDELEHFIQRHIITSTATTIADRWSGIMAMGSEKLPIVKKIAPHVFCAVRMSGMGVALAPVVGRQVSEMMLEEL